MAIFFFFDKFAMFRPHFGFDLMVDYPFDCGSQKFSSFFESVTRLSSTKLAVLTTNFGSHSLGVFIDIGQN